MNLNALDLNVKTWKNLLVVNGYLNIQEFAHLAHRMGVRIILADAYNDVESYQYADEVCIIDNIDNVDSIVALCYEKKIDGIISGNIEFLTTDYKKICDLMGFPCLNYNDSLGIFLDKTLLKNNCILSGIDVASTYEFTDINEDTIVNYPVIVKPVDSGGARGVHICNNYNELKYFYNVACSMSANKQVIIEEYLNGEDVSLYYYVVDGKAYLVETCDRYTSISVNSSTPLPLAYLFPARHTAEIFEKFNANFSHFFANVGMLNGAVSFQCIYNREKLYVYDASCRVFGLRDHSIITANSGCSLIEMFIRFALTGKMCNDKMPRTILNNMNNYNGCKILRYLGKGEIKKIVNTDFLAFNDMVLSYKLRFQEGESLSDYQIGSLQQVAYKVFMMSRDINELKKCIDEVVGKVDFLGVDSKSVLLEGFDSSILDSRHD